MPGFDELKRIEAEIRDRVLERMSGFKQIRDNGSEEEFFLELVFCTLTPQTKARMAEKAVDRLVQKDLVFHGSVLELAKELNIVRFRNHKAEYIVKNRAVCSRNGRIALKTILSEMPDVPIKREWIIQNVSGLGYKEASHFLRNTGYGQNIAILDRHILRNLQAFGVISDAGVSLTGSRYCEIENRMINFSEQIGIPMEVLDFVLWYKEARDVFK